MKTPLPRMNHPARVARLDHILQKNKNKTTKKRLPTSPTVSAPPKLPRTPSTSATTSDPYTEDF